MEVYKMNEKLEVLEKTDEGLVIVETKKYVATRQDIASELEGIRWQIQDRIMQNKRIQEDFKQLKAREATLIDALKNFDDGEQIEDLPTLK